MKMIAASKSFLDDDFSSHIIRWYKKLSITASSEISEASLNRAVSALYNAKVSLTSFPILALFVC